MWICVFICGLVIGVITGMQLVINHLVKYNRLSTLEAEWYLKFDNLITLIKELYE